MTGDDLGEQRFCASCGYEGSDMTCPICHKPMESFEEEVKRVAKIEEENKDIFEDVSLESEQDKEEKKENKDDETENI